MRRKIREEIARGGGQGGGGEEKSHCVKEKLSVMFSYDLELEKEIEGTTASIVVPSKGEFGAVSTDYRFSTSSSSSSSFSPAPPFFISFLLSQRKKKNLAISKQQVSKWKDLQNVQ